VPRYPELPPDRIVAALRRLGFYERRQRGSHLVMRRDEPFAQTVVPQHRVVKPLVLADILRQAGVPLDDFLKLL
jgi:predicted RNA binding protein YcfA (HicA-like mRNA interferase family)